MDEELRVVRLGGRGGEEDFRYGVVKDRPKEVGISLGAFARHRPRPFTPLSLRSGNLESWGCVLIPILSSFRWVFALRETQDALRSRRGF